MGRTQARCCPPPPALTLQAGMTHLFLSLARRGSEVFPQVFLLVQGGKAKSKPQGPLALLPWAWPLVSNPRPPLPCRSDPHSTSSYTPSSAGCQALPVFSWFLEGPSGEP